MNPMAFGELLKDKRVWAMAVALAALSVLGTYFQREYTWRKVSKTQTDQYATLRTQLDQTTQQLTQEQSWHTSHAEAYKRHAPVILPSGALALTPAGVPVFEDTEGTKSDDSATTLLLKDYKMQLSEATDSLATMKQQVAILESKVSKAGGHHWNVAYGLGAPASNLMAPRHWGGGGLDFPLFGCDLSASLLVQVPSELAAWKPENTGLMAIIMLHR